MRAVDLSGAHIGAAVSMRDEEGTMWAGRISGVEHGGLVADKVKVVLKVGSARIYVRCDPQTIVTTESTNRLAVVS